MSAVKMKNLQTMSLSSKWAKPRVTDPFFILETERIYSKKFRFKSKSKWGLVTSSFQVNLKGITNVKNYNDSNLIAKQHLDYLTLQKGGSRKRVGKSVRPYLRHTFCLNTGRACRSRTDHRFLMKKSNTRIRLICHVLPVPGLKSSKN